MPARQNKSLEKNYWSPIKLIINLDILPLGVTNFAVDDEERGRDGLVSNGEVYTEDALSF
jgi:hypothetical protein